MESLSPDFFWVPLSIFLSICVKLNIKKGSWGIFRAKGVEEVYWYIFMLAGAMVIFPTFYGILFYSFFCLQMLF